MKHAGMQQRDESGGFLEGADYGMSTNWYWNRQTDRRSEKENGNENPVLHYCSGGIKKTIGVTRGLAVAISCPMVSDCKDTTFF